MISEKTRASQRIRLNFPFSPEMVERDLSTIPESDWLPHVNTSCYHGDWEVIPLRVQNQLTEANPILQAFNIETGDGWMDLPKLQKMPSLLPIVHALKCQLKSIRLMRLAPKSEIKPHTDKGLCLEYGVARLHIPIQTNEHLSFYSNGIRLPMGIGELWYINAHQSHSVTNDGTTSRTNLVIDCEANDWLCKLMK